MKGGTTVLAAALSVALVVALGALSRLPVEGEHAGEAALRLTWRVRAEEVGECRHPSPEELAALPAHMRNPDACVGSIPPFRLTAEVDGARRVDAVIEAAGARGDRPLYVYRELLLEPGAHQVRIRFARDDGTESAPEAAGFLAFEGSVVLAPGQILLVTRSQDGRTLEARAPAP